MEILLNILTLGLRTVYERTNSYYLIVKEFKEKLPRPQNRARSLSKQELDSHPILKYAPSLKVINCIDVSTHKTTISEADLDLFYGKIDNFDYKYVIFKNHYKEFTRSLLRLNPEGFNKNYDLIVLQKLLQDDAMHPLKPFEVLEHHLKFKYKITSNPYVWFSNKRRRIKNKF
jgi:hypothetical protein